MGNLLIVITGVINKGGSQPFNAIEFYAVGEGTYTGYSLLQEGGVPQSDTNLVFTLDGGTNTPIVKGTFWRITNDAAAFSAYFGGVAANFVDPNLSLFDGTNIVDLLDIGLLDR